MASSKCKICETYFCAAHHGQKPFVCDIETCSKSYMLKKDLLRHKASVHEGIRHPCPICKVPLSTKSYVELHIDSVHNGLKRFACQQCEKVFTSPSTLRVHINVAHLINKKKFECSKCEKVFLRKSDLNQHFIRHGTTKPYNCDFCQMKFYTGQEKRWHTKTHKPMQKSFTCSLCDKAFTSKIGRKFHTDSVHNSLGKVSCVFCGNEYGSYTGMFSHIRRHIQETSHSCKLCSKQFYTFGDKNMHMRTHTGEKPYKCKTCGESFRSKVNMQSHEQRRHEKNMLYQCVFCEKGFYQSRDFLEHTLKEIKEKAFACKICGKEFISKRYLEWHNISHQPVKHMCPVCKKVYRVSKSLEKHLQKLHST